MMGSASVRRPKARFGRSRLRSAALCALVTLAGAPAASADETIVLGSDGSAYDPSTHHAPTFDRFVPPAGTPGSSDRVPPLATPVAPYLDPYPFPTAVLPSLPFPTAAEAALEAAQDELIYRRAIDRLADEDADVRIFLDFGGGSTSAGVSLAERELRRAQATYLFGLLNDLDDQRLGILLQP